MLKSFRDGHRFLRENATGRIAVGDQSGCLDHGRYNVHCCDDGVLWLDITRPVTLVKRRGRYNPNLGGFLIFIPLLTPKGEKASTIGSQIEAAFCHRTLGMDIVGEQSDFKADILAIKEGINIK